MDYLTLDIHIGPLTPAGYPLRAESRLGQAPAVGQPQPMLNLQPAAEPLAGLLAAVARGRAEQAELAALGERLAGALFVGEVGNLLRAVRGAAAGQPGTGVRIRLNAAAPELSALPWELLRLPGEADPLCVSTNGVVTRFLDVNVPLRDLAAPRPLRILGVLPKSAGVDAAGHKAALEKAVAAANAATDGAAGQGSLQLGWLEGTVTREHVRAALSQAEAHVLHFIGHGAFANGQPALQLTDDYGDPLTVSAATFAGFFRNRAGMRLVVLNACQGAKTDSANALLGVAPQIIAQGVPAVVAMQWDIYDWAAQAFAAAFYGTLCAGPEAGEVDTAITRARASLYDDGPDSRAFATPVLLLRAEGGRLWTRDTPSGQAQAAGAAAVQSGGVQIGDNAAIGGDVFSGGKQVVNTGGGQYYSAPINIQGDVQGDFVGGNKTVHQTAGGDIVGRDKITNQHGFNPAQQPLADQFDYIGRRIDARPADPRIDKDEIRETVRRLAGEAQKGEAADAARVSRWLLALASQATDIFEITAATLSSPALGIAAPVQQAARAARRQVGGRG